MSEIDYGPLRFFIGRWESVGHDGENQALDLDRKVENTKFRQEMFFEPIGCVENHEQLLYVLRYQTKAWEEGDDSSPFHEEVGYFIWDNRDRQVMKSFSIPRGVTVNAGGTAELNAIDFTLKATLGSETYGICSNNFLNEEFQTVSYEVKFEFLDEDIFTYSENSRLKVKGQEALFDHSEKNTLRRKS